MKGIEHRTVIAATLAVVLSPAIAAALPPHNPALWNRTKPEPRRGYTKEDAHAVRTYRLNATNVARLYGPHLSPLVRSM